MAEPVQAGHGDSEFQDWEHPGNTTTFRTLTEVSSAQPPTPPFPFTFSSPALIQFPAETAPPIHQAQYQTFLPGSFAPTQRHAKPSPRRCALCVKAECDRRPDCPGKGGQKLCRCGHPPLKRGEQVRTSEAAIKRRQQARNQAQSQGQ
ncbi:hypothetical protein B0H11DRAFT_1931436 [Mycena galericulata]|nr:hypothetical protein B0H11DRAFT_1931436 [Mycena galericulata]